MVEGCVGATGFNAIEVMVPRGKRTYGLLSN